MRTNWSFLTYLSNAIIHLLFSLTENYELMKKAESFWACYHLGFLFWPALHHVYHKLEARDGDQLHQHVDCFETQNYYRTLNCYRTASWKFFSDRDHWQGLEMIWRQESQFFHQKLRSFSRPFRPYWARPKQRAQRNDNRPSVYPEILVKIVR